MNLLSSLVTSACAFGLCQGEELDFRPVRALDYSEPITRVLPGPARSIVVVCRRRSWVLTRDGDAWAMDGVSNSARSGGSRARIGDSPVPKHIEHLMRLWGRDFTVPAADGDLDAYVLFSTFERECTRRRDSYWVQHGVHGSGGLAVQISRRSCFRLCCGDHNTLLFMDGKGRILKRVKDDAHGPEFLWGIGGETPSLVLFAETAVSDQKLGVDVVAYSPKGLELWRRHIGDGLTDSLSVAQTEDLLTCSVRSHKEDISRHSVHTLSLRNGKELGRCTWARLGINCLEMSANGTCVAASCGDSIRLMRLPQTEAVWRRMNSFRRAYPENIPSDSKVAGYWFGHPSVSDAGQVLVPLGNHFGPAPLRLLLLSAKDGKILWQKDIEEPMQITYSRGPLISISADGRRFWLHKESQSVLYHRAL